jgi:hypothetical protein
MAAEGGGTDLRATRASEEMRALATSRARCSAVPADPTPIWRICSPGPGPSRRARHKGGRLTAEALIG